MELFRQLIYRQMDGLLIPKVTIATEKVCSVDEMLKATIVLN